MINKEAQATKKQMQKAIFANRWLVKLIHGWCPHDHSIICTCAKSTYDMSCEKNATEPSFNEISLVFHVQVTFTFLPSFPCVLCFDSTEADIAFLE